MSSMAVYGDGTQESGVTESWPTVPQNIYALSKLNAEQIGTVCGRLHGVRVTNLRLFNAFGPGQSLRNAETGVVAIWTAAFLRGETPVVYEDGHQLRDFIYATDVAQAVRLAVQNQPRCEVVNVGTGVPTSVGHVANYLADRLGRPRPTPIGRCRLGDARHCWGDITRARKVMDFVPAMTLLEGFDRTVEWARTPPH